MSKMPWFKCDGDKLFNQALLDNMEPAQIGKAFLDALFYFKDLPEGKYRFPLDKLDEVETAFFNSVKEDIDSSREAYRNKNGGTSAASTHSNKPADLDTLRKMDVRVPNQSR